jgi:predicted nucleic acid-binding Zn ribbon protein
LIFHSVARHGERVDDWEQFFQEKSRRRLNRERRRRRQRNIAIALGSAVIGLAIAAGIVGLNAFG